MVVDPQRLAAMIEPSRSQDAPPFCVACGYDMTGAVSERCPECGTVFVRKEWRDHVEAVKRRMHEVEDANSWAVFGLKGAIGGLLVLILCVIVKKGFSVTFLRGVAGILGAMAVLMGLGVLRAGSLPKWARERLTHPPRMEIVAGALLIGAVDVALAIFGPF